MELRHYFHLYADGEYRQIVREHFSALRQSGLAKRLDRLHLCFIGSEENRAAARHLVRQLWPREFTSNEAANGWEQETLDVLHADACSADAPFLALYAHTKGAWNPDPVNPPWRVIMTRETVTKWREATATIKGNVAACGCFWAPFDNGRIFNIEGGTQYFAGNFWWAKSQAIARLNRPERINRFDSEKWIGGVTRANPPYDIAVLFDCPLDLPDLVAAAAMRMPTSAR